MEEVTVFQRFLQLCEATASGMDAMGHFELGDLVQIDAQTVGCIIRLEKEMFRILTMQNKVITLNNQAVSKKRANKFAAALDCENKTVTPNDIVKCVDGVQKDQTGQVKYLYRHYAFIYSKTYPENAGYFVCTTKQLLLASSGGKTSIPSANTSSLMINQGYMSPRVMASPMHPSSSNGANGASSTRTVQSTSTSSSVHGAKTPRTPLQQQQQVKAGATRRNTALIGKTVRITQGPYKGYVGIVKDATDTTARVELHTKCQTISVDLIRLTIVDGKSGTGMGRTPSLFSGAQTPSYSGAQTPTHHGSRTPIYGSATPMHDGSRTPHYGSATPRYDGSMTPSHHTSGGGGGGGGGGGSAWDPASVQTPARNDFEDDWDEQPPSASLNPTTPGYQAETPSDAASATTAHLLNHQPASVGQVPSVMAHHHNPPSHAGPYTPGSALNYVSHSPYTVNPSPLDGYQHSNLFSNQVPTPGGAGSSYSSTNSPAGAFQNYIYSPSTPGGGFYAPPQTPGANAYNLDHMDWHMDGLMVRIRDTYHDIDLCGATGIIRSIHVSFDFKKKKNYFESESIFLII
jgi:transcription elongation factor SPT5